VPIFNWLKQVLGLSQQHLGVRTPASEILVATTDYGEMLVYRADSVIGKSLIESGSFQEGKLSEVVSFLVDHYNFSPGIFVDVGANIGTHTIYALVKLGFKRAVCFEPNNQNFDLLLLNTKRNLISNDPQPTERVAPGAVRSALRRRAGAHAVPPDRSGG
jgi:hypothetical protein